ncbi:MAG: transcriptional regulator [Propionibacteriaceae bacterium]|jgi:DNA-binding transcriptional regulator LsrR (DeoR family)|nr:transcriptional regulator [Propionibacteriaceae bacterium]
MHNRYDDMYEAATRYYVQGETMELIARTLRMSRSSVSRLLADARSSGMVRISIDARQGSASPIARALTTMFNVRVHLAQVGDALPATARLERVSRLAAAVLRDTVADNSLIGVAWGATLSNIMPFLDHRPLIESTVVQMNGGTNIGDTSARHVAGILQEMAKAFEAQIVQFPVPAFFDYAATKQAMWRERSVRFVRNLQSELDVAIFGIGAINGRIPSHVYTAGFLDESELRALKAQRVVGDVCTVLLRQDGSWEDIELNERASGLTPPELQRIRCRIGVVGDPSRASALLGALRANTITDLVCDDVTARRVAELVEAEATRRF